MVTLRREFGNAGEDFVANYLQQEGFTIFGQNYRKFFGEIDIIAHKKELYIFVEVKTRKPTNIAMGQLISDSKQKKIIKTAQAFIAEQQLSNKIYRFDVALVTFSNNRFTLEYLENAFTTQQAGYDRYY